MTLSFTQRYHPANVHRTANEINAGATALAHSRDAEQWDSLAAKGAGRRSSVVRTRATMTGIVEFRHIKVLKYMLAFL